MYQVTVRMRKIIRTFKALICKRFYKLLNSNSNDVSALILLWIEILCLQCLAPNILLLVLGLLKLGSPSWLSKLTHPGRWLSQSSAC